MEGRMSEADGRRSTSSRTVRDANSEDVTVSIICQSGIRLGTLQSFDVGDLYRDAQCLDVCHSEESRILTEVRATPKGICLHLPTRTPVGEIGSPPAWQAPARTTAANGKRLAKTETSSVHATTASEPSSVGIDGLLASRMAAYCPARSCPTQLGTPQRPTSGETGSFLLTRSTASMPSSVGIDSFSAILAATQKPVCGDGHSSPTQFATAHSAGGDSFEVIV